LKKLENHENCHTDLIEWFAESGFELIDDALMRNTLVSLSAVLYLFEILNKKYQPLVEVDKFIYERIYMGFGRKNKCAKKYGRRISV
jgi:hypothetical protein